MINPCVHPSILPPMNVTNHFLTVVKNKWNYTSNPSYIFISCKEAAVWQFNNILLSMFRSSKCLLSIHPFTHPSVSQSALNFLSMNNTKHSQQQSAPPVARYQHHSDLHHPVMPDRQCSAHCVVHCGQWSVVRGLHCLHLWIAGRVCFRQHY